MASSKPGAALRGYIALSLVWLLILVVTLLFLRRPSTQPIEILLPPSASPVPGGQPPPATPSATPAPLHIDVAGAVKNPAVYRLTPGSIVADAIAAAGGPAADAQLDRLNKALPLMDGMQVYVPRLGEDLPPAAALAGVHFRLRGSRRGDAGAGDVSTSTLPPHRSWTSCPALARPSRKGSSPGGPIARSRTYCAWRASGRRSLISSSHSSPWNEPGLGQPVSGEPGLGRDSAESRSVRPGEGHRETKNGTAGDRKRAYLTVIRIYRKNMVRFFLLLCARTPGSYQNPWRSCFKAPCP